MQNNVMKRLDKVDNNKKRRTHMFLILFCQVTSHYSSAPLLQSHFAFILMPLIATLVLKSFIKVIQQHIMTKYLDKHSTKWENNFQPIKHFPLYKWNPKKSTLFSLNNWHSVYKNITDMQLNKPQQQPNRSEWG